MNQVSELPSPTHSGYFEAVYAHIHCYVTPSRSRVGKIVSSTATRKSNLRENEK